LSQSGGHAKAQKRLLRTIIGPQTARTVQEQNEAEGRTSRLYGDDALQQQNGPLLANLLSKKEVSSMMNCSKLNTVGVRMFNHYLEKIGSKTGPTKILESCNRNGITLQGYDAIYKDFKGEVKVTGCGVRVECLPNPHQLSLLRREMNSKLEDMIGSYSHIDNTLSIPQSSKLKHKDPIKLVMSPMNSFFVDIESVQKTMVRLFGITPAGTC